MIWKDSEKDRVVKPRSMEVSWALAMHGPRQAEGRRVRGNAEGDPRLKQCVRAKSIYHTSIRRAVYLYKTATTPRGVCRLLSSIDKGSFRDS